MTHNHEAADTPEEIRVAEVLQQIRAGIRQRQAELAALRGQAQSAEETQTYQRFHELQSLAYVRAQPFASETPVIGRLIVLVRELWCNVATRWYIHPILRQQNDFNQALVDLFREMYETQNDTRQRLEQVEQRLVSMDRDMTLLARKMAEGEYRARQGELEANALASRLGKLEHGQEVQE
jgi:hypothetical protein